MASKSVCRALLVLNIAYCVLAAKDGELPGWHMFEAVQPTAHTLRDRDGNVIDVASVVPRGAYFVDRGMLLQVVTWICEQHRDRAPFVLEEGGKKTTIGVDCHAP